MKRLTIHILVLLAFSCTTFLVAAQPVASFVINYPLHVCDTATVSFSNTSSADTTLSYSWQFGNISNTDTATNPSFTFDTCGFFEVILTATDALGQSDADTQTVFINCSPNAAFSASTIVVCNSGTVFFTDGSTPNDSIVAWNWNFGDPSSGALNVSTLKDPSHLFDEEGTYFISLTVTSAGGCQDSHIDSIHVFVPQSLFEVDGAACINDSTHFIDISSSTDPVVSWLWNFADPSSGSNTSTLQNSYHVFQNAGEYNVRLTITTLHGCLNSLAIPITIHASPHVDAGSDQIMCPLDSVQLQASGANSFHWSPGSFVSDSMAANPFAFPISTSFFFVTGTDTNGCSAVDSMQVIVRPFPDANAGNDTAICIGTTAQLQASGGISYQWSADNTLNNDTIANPVANPLVTTTYFVTVKDSAGCISTDSVTVIVSPIPIVNITGLNDHYCENGEPVELAAIPPGGIFSGDGVTETTFFPSNLAAGNSYFIFYSYTDSFGCSASDTVSVDILSPPVISISTADSSLCINASPAAIIFSPTGGILTGTGVSNNLFDPSIAGVPGIFTVTYFFTDTSGCSNADSMSMTVLALPPANAGTDTTICFGDSVQLLASGGIAYSWSPDSTLSNGVVDNPIAFPLSTTAYVVVATDTNGCSNADTVLISVFSLLDIDAGPDQAICAGDSATLQATGGSSYLWQPVEGLSNNAIANPLASPGSTTTYTVTFNPGSNCPATDSITISVHPLPIISASHDSSFCKGDTVQLFAAGAQSYLWEPTAFLSDSTTADPLAFPQVSTNYTVTGTDSFGCSNTDSVMLQVLSLPIIDAGSDTVLCAGDSIQLSGSGGISYVWTPGNSLSDDSISNPLAFPIITTTYILSGTDVTGCSNTDSVNVFVLSQNLVDAGNDTSICTGDSTMLQASGGLTYSWSPAAGLSDTSIANPMAYPQSTTTYTVTVSVGTDCSFSDTVTITVNELPLVTASADTMLCPGDSIQIMASGASTYEWSPASSLSESQIQNPVAFPGTTTTYTVVGTNLFGCKNSDSVKVSLLAAPIASAGNDTAICLGDSVALQASGGITFLWSPSSSLSNPSISNPIAFPLTTTTYSVKVNDGGICFGYDTVIITVNPLPIANAGNDLIACSGIPIQLNASGGAEYLWSPADGLSDSTISNPFATVTASTYYSVTVTDQNHCSASDSVYVAVAPPLVAFINGDTTICKGTSAMLLAGGGESYGWFPSGSLSDPNTDNPVATPEITTTYFVVVSDGICYADTLHTTVVVSAPSIDAGSDATIITGEAYQVSATASSGTYVWLPPDGLSCIDCLNPMASPAQTTTYTVTVTDSIGCTASDDLTISVGCNESAIFIPNAFTPDNNGHNDVLLVRSDGAIQLSYFRIFDRWGKIIFESNNISDGWDGTYKNKPMSPGVYLFTMEATCGNGEIIRKQGNVTLLK